VASWFKKVTLQLQQTSALLKEKKMCEFTGAILLGLGIIAGLMVSIIMEKWFKMKKELGEKNGQTSS